LVDTGSSEYAMVKDLLGQGETVELETVEHRLGGAKFLDPAHVFATNYGIIIVKRNILGFHSDYKIIRYESITDVKVARGPLFCRIHFNLLGEQADPEGTMKWLVGIPYKDALDLIHLVSKMEQKPVHEVVVPSDSA
jgi:hypothetical protein